jgi:hypothetical protein
MSRNILDAWCWQTAAEGALHFFSARLMIHRVRAVQNRCEPDREPTDYRGAPGFSPGEIGVCAGVRSKDYGERVDGMSKQRTMPGGHAVRAELPKGPSGRALCRWCGLEVQGRRHTFCSDWCVHEWRLRTDPGYLREQVFARDRGRCALCHIDSVEAFRRLKRCWCIGA